MTSANDAHDDPWGGMPPLQMQVTVHRCSRCFMGFVQRAHCARHVELPACRGAEIRTKTAVVMNALDAQPRRQTRTSASSVRRTGNTTILDHKITCSKCSKARPAVMKGTRILKTCAACLDEVRTKYAKNPTKRVQRSYSYEKFISDAHFRIRCVKNGAKQRGYEYALTDEQAETLLRGACEYCGHKDNDAFNGIDRVDNSQGYVAGNCVSACKTCNRMKLTASAEEFVQRCAHISGLAVCSEAFPDAPHAGQYDMYVSNAARRGLAFKLSKEEFLELTQRDCKYCGKPSTATHTNGVDRVNNSQGYVAGNCVTACKTCNFMKHALTVHEFLLACEHVAVYL